MTSLVTPIHIGTVNGSSVRFFKSPFDRPEMPWHAFYDLTAAVRYDMQLARSFAESVQSDWPNTLQTVATNSGIVLIGPHYMAQGTVGAAIHNKRCKPAVEFEYAVASAQVLDILMADVPPHQFAEHIGQAYRNSQQVGGLE
jgi:hypothetical protein